jgi:hypothetical protein
MQIRIGRIARITEPPNHRARRHLLPRRNRDTALLHMGIESVDAFRLADEDIVAAEILRLVQRRWRLERVLSSMPSCNATTVPAATA